MSIALEQPTLTWRTAIVTVLLGVLVLTFGAAGLALLVGRALPITHEIAYVSEASGDAEVLLLDIERGITRNLTHRRAWDRDFAWSWDGQRLAIHTNASGEWELHTVTLGQAHSERRLTNNALMETNFAWMPGDEQITFIEGSTGVIFTVDVNAPNADVQPVENDQLWM